MLRRIKRYFLIKKLERKYYKEQAEKMMEEYLKEDKRCVGIYDKKGNIKRIKKLDVI